jgi:hypothetical protein
MVFIGLRVWNAMYEERINPLTLPYARLPASRAFSATGTNHAASATPDKLD